MRAQNTLMQQANQAELCCKSRFWSEEEETARLYALAGLDKLYQTCIETSHFFFLFVKHCSSNARKLS